MVNLIFSNFAYLETYEQQITAARDPSILTEGEHIMRTRHALACALIAIGTCTMPIISSAGVDIQLDIAPPVARVEAVPPPRAGYVWAPGYWAWEGGHHVWVAGRWIHARAHQHWVPDAWVQAGPHWRYAPGHWER